MKKLSLLDAARSLAIAACALGFSSGAKAQDEPRTVTLRCYDADMPDDNGWDYEDEIFGAPDCPTCDNEFNGCSARGRDNFAAGPLRARAFRINSSREYDLRPGHRITRVDFLSTGRYERQAGVLTVRSRSNGDVLDREVTFSTSCGDQPSINVTSLKSNWTESDVQAYNVAITQNRVSTTLGEVALDSIGLRVRSDCYLQATGTVFVSNLEPCEGSGLLLRAPANIEHAGTLRYEWFRNDALVGAASELPLPANLTNSGDYKLRVHNDCMQVDYPPVHIRVVPTTRVQPLSSTGEFCPGDSVSLCAEATGENLSYTWYRNGQPIGSERCMRDAQPSEGVQTYFCRVAGRCGTVDTNTFTAVTRARTEFVRFTGAGDYCVGDPVRLCVIANGYNLSYEWSRDGVPVGGNTSCLDLPSATGSSGNYTCRITGRCGTVTSPAARVDVRPLTQVSPITGGGTFCETQAITLCENATGSNLSYRWRKNGVDLGLATACISLTSSPSSSGSYDCVVSGDCGVRTTDPVTVTVNPKTRVTVDLPSAETHASGDPLTLHVEGTGTGVVRYQWYKDGQPLADGDHVSGSQTNTLRLTPGRYADRGLYACVLTSECFSASSSNCDVTVFCREPVRIIENPRGGSAGTDRPFELCVVATGTGPMTFQWYFNNEPIVDDPSGPTGFRTPCLQFGPVCLLDDGIYFCRVTNDCGDVVETRRARLRTTCLADFNDDLFVDFFDYLDFALCFEGERCPPGKDADFNGDGFLDFFDYSDFVEVFENGCCR